MVLSSRNRIDLGLLCSINNGGGDFIQWSCFCFRYHNLFAGLIGLSGAYEISRVLPATPVMWLLNGIAALSPKMPLKPIFNPELIVSDADALAEWRQDPLVSRGKATVAYITTIASVATGLASSIPSITTPMLMMWGTGDKVVSLEVLPQLFPKPSFIPHYSSCCRQLVAWGATSPLCCGCYSSDTCPGG